MANNFTHFKLYDTDILNLLEGTPTKNLLCHRTPPDHTGVFDSFQLPALIYAIYRRNYAGAYKLLNSLSAPLSPRDAMAACLCALTASDRLFHTVLAHCPPLPDFQFQGVGAVSSLLNVVAELDAPKRLEVLLNRGADPNSGPLETSPLEAAFCSRSYSCMTRLLDHPDIHFHLTEPILNELGQLQLNPADPTQDVLHLWCCQTLLEHLSDTALSLPFDLPLPPQLQIKHALQCNNLELAERLCRERPLSEEELTDLRHFLHQNLSIALPLHFYLSPDVWLSFLSTLLERYPDLLGEPDPDKLSPLAMHLLETGSDEQLLHLLQPGKLLQTEHPSALLNTCQNLPLSRRNLILPHIRKEIDYAL